jgi:hypothetical protein
MDLNLNLFPLLQLHRFGRHKAKSGWKRSQWRFKAELFRKVKLCLVSNLIAFQELSESSSHDKSVKKMVIELRSATFHLLTYSSNCWLSRQNKKMSLSFLLSCCHPSNESLLIPTLSSFDGQCRNAFQHFIWKTTFTIKNEIFATYIFAYCQMSWSQFCDFWIYSYNASVVHRRV